jgi:antitoxin component YwqK of YwqJK toxin-antitoxin module
MKLNVTKHPKTQNLRQLISRWSNGNIHFILNYDETGNWVDGKVETYYVDGAIKSVHFCKKSTTEGEALSFDAADEFSKKESDTQFKNFLNE